MISIIYEEGKLDVKGHSGYAPRGQDIVCAGVSTLMFTLAEQLDYDGVQIHMNEFHVRYDPSDQDAMDAARYTISGLKLLARQYPQYITINRVG